MQRCTVIINEKPIPEELLDGDYENDDTYRLHFQQWVQMLWEEKDRQLDALHSAS